LLVDAMVEGEIAVKNLASLVHDDVDVLGRICSQPVKKITYPGNLVLVFGILLVADMVRFGMLFGQFQTHSRSSRHTDPLPI
jgi:hypothetical protein